MGEGYMKKVRDTANSWRQIYLMELALYTDTITKTKAKKEEERAARAMIELRKKNVEYKTVSAELTTSQSEHQELRGKVRSLENTLQAHQQHLNDLL
ncbi:hypothetical protein Gotur_025382, partial [Gossypium turneri]